MITPSTYGNSAEYVLGPFPYGALFLTPPAGFLSGLGTYFQGIQSNLPVRDVCCYSQPNLRIDQKRHNPGTVFVGRWGLSRAAFPLNSNWTQTGSLG